MVRLTERILLIGDVDRAVQSALTQAAPGAQVNSVPTVFDAIAELCGGRAGNAPANGYTTILAAAEPIERRPEAAVRTLRSLAAGGRLVLFGHPTLELLSRKMLQFGCDDYIVTPATAGELQQVFGSPPPLRLAAEQTDQAAAEPSADPPEERADNDADGASGDSEEGENATVVDAAPAEPPAAPAVGFSLAGLPLAEVILDAQLHSPHDAPSAAVRQLNARLGPNRELAFRRTIQGREAEGPEEREGRVLLSRPVRSEGEDVGTLYLSQPRDEDETTARHALSHLAHLLGKLTALQQRHNGLQEMAITDELTGVRNARYFRHFLSRIIERARKMHFPVTLLLFDIDDFKQYNDQFGHGVGDEILKQTAALMKACTRDHDLVARIGGDEFAVVFWDKEGPRQPRDPRPGVSGRPPHTPAQVYQRFKRKIESERFPVLGSSGKGVLGISAGLAVFPYEAHDVQSLIQEADRRLMQGAKKASGKNTLFIVGPEEAGGASGGR